MTQTPANTHTGRLSGVSRVAAAGLIWGTIPLIIRFADGAPAVTVFFRMFFGGLVVAAWMAGTGRLGELKGLGTRKLVQVGIQGLILTLNWFLFLTALDLTNVATAELLAYCGPVFVAALAPAVTGERFDARIIGPLALALGGIIVILAPQGLAVAEPSELLGAGMALASALTYTALLLRSKKILRGISSGALMVIEYTVASVVLAPFVASAWRSGDMPSSPGAYAALVTLGVVHTGLTGALFLGGLRRVRTDRVAILMYLEPASAVVFAALFLGEALTVTTVLGGAMVIGGGLLVARLEEQVEAVPLEAAGTEQEEEPESGNEPLDPEHTEETS